jgi:hypothetical protein
VKKAPAPTKAAPKTPPAPEPPHAASATAAASDRRATPHQAHQWSPDSENSTYFKVSGSAMSFRASR